MRRVSSLAQVRGEKEPIPQTEQKPSAPPTIHVDAPNVEVRPVINIPTGAPPVVHVAPPDLKVMEQLLMVIARKKSYTVEIASRDKNGRIESMNIKEN